MVQAIEVSNVAIVLCRIEEVECYKFLDDYWYKISFDDSCWIGSWIGKSEVCEDDLCDSIEDFKKWVDESFKEEMRKIDEQIKNKQIKEKHFLENLRKHGE